MGQAWRALKKLKLVHTDLCNPIRIHSLDNNKYFILFIDDYSRITRVYFMKYRFKVFKTFCKFKNFIEKKSSCQLENFRSDNRKEYTSSKFNKFYDERYTSSV